MLANFITKYIYKKKLLVIIVNKNIILINHKDLTRFKKKLPLSMRPLGKQVICQFPQLSVDDNLYWQKQINRYAFSCGCTEGGIGGLVGLIIILLRWQLLEIKFDSWKYFFSSLEFYISITIIVLLIVCGKLLAIWYARWRLNKNIDKLMILLNNS